MKVVVTGASGLTGREVAEQLVGAKHDVVGIARRQDHIAGVRLVEGDCRDPAVMTGLLHGADALVHVAGILHGPQVAQIGGLGAVEHLVVVSSAGVYSSHRASASAYRTGESALRGAHPRATIIRPTMIFGSSRDRNVHHLIAFADRFGMLPLIGRGEAELQPIYYKDLAKIIVSLLERPSSLPIDVGGAAPLAVVDAFVAILRELGRPVRLIRLPVGPVLWLAQLVDATRGTRLAERVERLGEERAVDNALMISLTGIHPRSFEDGLRAEIREMRAAGAVR